MRFVKCFSRIHRQSAVENFNFPLHSIYSVAIGRAANTTTYAIMQCQGKARVKFYLAGVSLFLDEQIRRKLQNKKGLYVLFRNAASHKGL
jgi:hypothetical protein